MRTIRPFGVEIEALAPSRAAMIASLTAAGINVRDEGYNHLRRTHWKVVRDASVSGAGLEPFELVSPPTCDLDEVERVCAALNAAGSLVNRTCGLHVHFDARDLLPAQWGRLVKLWLRYEAAIDSVMPRSRRANANRYCRSVRSMVLARCSSSQRDFAGMFATVDRMAGSREDLARGLFAGDRYFKLNLQSWWKHGTIEFRQHSGSTSGRKVTLWIRLLAAILDYAASSTPIVAGDATLTEMLDELAPFSSSVLGETAPAAPRVAAPARRRRAQRSPNGPIARARAIFDADRSQSYTEAMQRCVAAGILQTTAAGAWVRWRREAPAQPEAPVAAAPVAAIPSWSEVRAYFLERAADLAVA